MSDGPPEKIKLLGYKKAREIENRLGLVERYLTGRSGSREQWM